MRAALPGRVAAADAVTLDAGPRAHERVGHIYQSVSASPSGANRYFCGGVERRRVHRIRRRWWRSCYPPS